MKIFAHRGASGLYPENTESAIKAALALKVDGIEIDLQNSTTIVNSVNLRFSRQFEVYNIGGSGIRNDINFRYNLHAKQNAGDAYTLIATSTDVADVYNANLNAIVDWTTAVSTTISYRYWKIEFTDNAGATSGFVNLKQLNFFEELL